ncbi:hypothetical protein E4T44_01225 [Aureobasidium sp. EXF-8845]|nr:hypothetical protein E4T44_01225 [Aureobasidium sp. EXF-8845]KAI4857337.1 hypothetical protein E4T45_01168 [Aureobasidium sp. EXF-8846]
MPSKGKEMPHSWEFVVEANHRGTIEDLDLALLAAFQESEEAYNICVTSARANASIGAASVSSTYGSSPKELTAVLVSRGWDLNQRQPVNGTYNSAKLDECNKRLIQLVCRDEEMVQWCLAHGAIVDETDETLLADVASYGSINTFRLLHEHGAPISESTLHNAAWRARPEMVTFLVDKIGMDTNRVYNGRHEPMLQHRTPLCSAVISPFKAAGEVARILLERGADPYHKDCNAFEEATNDLAIEVLRKWETKQEKDQEEPRTKKTEDIKLGQFSQCMI